MHRQTKRRSRRSVSSHSQVGSSKTTRTSASARLRSAAPIVRRRISSHSGAWTKWRVEDLVETVEQDQRRAAGQHVLQTRQLAADLVGEEDVELEAGVVLEAGGVGLERQQDRHRLPGQAGRQRPARGVGARDVDVLETGPRQLGQDRLETVVGEHLEPLVHGVVDHEGAAENVGEAPEGGLVGAPARGRVATFRRRIATDRAMIGPSVRVAALHRRRRDGETELHQDL